jgi:5-methylthioribose kinase
MPRRSSGWRVYFKEVERLGWDGLEARAVRHTLGCLLARVAGKSPLEYLTPEELARQGQVVLRILSRAPICGSDLIAEFIREIEAHA